MGVLPLQFIGNNNAKKLKITGSEIIDIFDLDQDIKPNKIVKCCVKFKNNKKNIFQLKVRIDSEKELEYMKNGGILPYVFKQVLKKEKIESFKNI